jgi:hypothetical protein
MRVQFALCAQSASIDRATSRISIFNVFDHFPVSTTPVSIPAVTFVSAIETDTDDLGEIKGVIELYGGDGLIGMAQVPITFTAANRLARVIVNFQGIPVNKTGPLCFRLTLPDGTVAESVFQVISVADRSALQIAQAEPPVQKHSS